jgi:hypothetical protein
VVAVPKEPVKGELPNLDGGSLKTSVVLLTGDRGFESALVFAWRCCP